MLSAIADALSTTGLMAWRIAWSLVLGFTLSAVVQALVRKETVSRYLGDDRPATLARASGFGAAASSCSYAAVALARTLYRKGASFTAAMVFQIASTNLVIELGIVLALLMGWRFTLAEFVGGGFIIVLVALAFRMVLGEQVLRAARSQADRGLTGSMEGHAAMDMSVQREGSLLRRLFSRDGGTAVSHIFVMEWAAVLRDVLLGLVVAGAVAAWVPRQWWQTLFLSDDPLLSALWGPVVGPVVAVLSFVCSIGNVPLAAVLWNSGISFGGVISFLFADLLIVPILLIYRKYYGTGMMLRVAGVFYVCMVIAGYLVELLFGAAGLVPGERSAYTGAEDGISWNYTTWLNIVFLALAAVLVAVSLRNGGWSMLRSMDDAGEDGHEHAHS
ncbi:permease [Phycicoccus endophyticus]|uniref:permease n=1 Tax=Phycicoccus endophyticus TaxID=1690220 RepID=UPI00197B3D0E|nr:permease [Phycicoccus endophyticus]GGL38857.1 membrane protein [Phycicoccus endophyticus]